MEVNENPLLLYLDTLRANKNPASSDLLLSHEHRLWMGSQRMFLWTWHSPPDAIEPERIAIDHVAKMTVPSQGSATLAYATEVEEAVVALKERIQLMQNFLKEVERGQCSNEPSFAAPHIRCV